MEPENSKRKKGKKRITPDHSTNIGVLPLPVTVTPPGLLRLDPY